MKDIVGKGGNWIVVCLKLVPYQKVWLLYISDLEGRWRIMIFWKAKMSKMLQQDYNPLQYTKGLQPTK